MFPVTRWGARYCWEEATPGSEHGNLLWEVFLQACKDIGYDGCLSHEQCSPILTKEHKLGGIDTVDQHYIDTCNFFSTTTSKTRCLHRK